MEQAVVYTICLLKSSNSILGYIRSLKETSVSVSDFCCRVLSFPQFSPSLQITASYVDSTTDGTPMDTDGTLTAEDAHATQLK